MRLAVVIAVALLCAPAALADGDPASDYLISQPVFLPLTVPTTADRGAELTQLLTDAKQQGFPLKVAIIAKARDLGSVPSLYGHPERYARFLGQEDFYFFKDELLVVMPQGFGVFKQKGLPKADVSLVAKLPAPATTNGDELIAAAERAVQKLAAQRGIQLEVKPVSSGSGRSRDRIVIIAGVLVLLAIGVVIRMVVRRR